MSILAEASSGNLRTQAVFAAGCLAVAVFTALGLRRWGRGRGAPFPERVSWRASAWPVVGAMGVGVFCWWTASSAFLTYKQAQLIARMGPDAKLDLAMLSPRDMAVLATVPPLAAFVVLVGAGAYLRRTGAYDLGLGLRRLRRGVFLGVLGSVCVVPMMFGLMVLIEWVYRWLHFQHPEEHELLHALGQTRDPLVVVPLVAGAAIIAPLFEELLFRAHLQTVLRRLFAWFAYGVLGQGPSISPVAEASPVGGPGEASSPYAGDGSTPPPEVAGTIPYAPAVREPAEFVSPAWTGWAAILLTSALFASVHAMWTWPPIFILAVCLGYAYERTGNLWVPILIHAAFNTVSTLVFLGGLAN
jgi:membrane protease YdiL (CAAX protease family)